jgi:DNA-binding NarL/FixJ family response regulator
MKKLRVFLAEDHALVREGLRMIINSQPDMTIVGEAEDGRTSVPTAKAVSPDLAVIDVVLPGLPGAAVTEAMVREIPGIRVLALTVQQDRAYVRQVMNAGASGYVLKLTRPAEFLQAIRTVAAGGIYVDPHVARNAIGPRLASVVAVDETSRPVLTDREIELVQLVARGYSNKEIAVQLDVTVKTVETYKARVMEKLGFHSRVQLIQFAIHQGWLCDVK